MPAGCRSGGGNDRTPPLLRPRAVARRRPSPRRAQRTRIDFRASPLRRRAERAIAVISPAAAESRAPAGQPCVRVFAELLVGAPVDAAPDARARDLLDDIRPPDIAPHEAGRVRGAQRDGRYLAAAELGIEHGLRSCAVAGTQGVARAAAILDRWHRCQLPHRERRRRPHPRRLWRHPCPAGRAEGRPGSGQSVPLQQEHRAARRSTSRLSPGNRFGGRPAQRIAIDATYIT